MGHGMDRDVRKVAVEPVGVQREAWDGADRIADLEALDARPNRGNGSRRLVPRSSGKLRFFQILAAAKHSLSAVESQRVDANLNLIIHGWRDLDLLNLEDFGSTDLMKSHDSRHVCLLLRVIRRQTVFMDSSGRGNPGDAPYTLGSWA